MELHQIRYFLAVHKTGSFTAAAKLCNVSQPSLSAQLSKLESELGGPLFERSRQGARPTERGRVFLPRAMEVAHQVESVGTEMEELDGLKRGEVFLGCLPTTGAYLLPELLAAFGMKYPDIHVSLLEESSPGLARALRDFEIDAAIIDEAGMGPGLSGDKLFTEPLYLAVPPDHPMAQRRIVELSEFVNENIILMKQGHGFHSIVRKALEDAGVEVHVVYESAEIETVQGLVAAGLGISLVPGMVRKAYGIAYLEIAAPSPSRTLLFAYREGGTMSPATSALREIALDRLRRSQD